MKKSGAAREQVERAEFAKAACFYAIASRSMKLYGDVMMWLKRFIRDPVCIPIPLKFTY